MVTRTSQRTGSFVLVLLLIEFMDELVFGIEGAAWPLIQAELALSYAQIGILLSAPRYFSMLVEPFMGIGADMGLRRWLVLGGGVMFTLALIGVALSQSFWMFLIVSIMLYPASGAFVSIAQATLMDYEPQRHEQNMARWTFAGSIGVTAGPLVMALALSAGGTWRQLFMICAVMAAALVIWTARFRFPRASEEVEPPESMLAGFKIALRAFRDRSVLRWIVLLEFSDLMLDVLLAYLALYMVNEVGVSPEQGALAVTVWSVVGLLGDFLIIPALERIRGLTYLRISAVIIFMLYPMFLLVDSFVLKLVVLGLLGFFNAGWYSILQGQLYSSMPGRSGTVLAVQNFGGFIGSAIPLILGLVAHQFSLTATMWLLLLGPVALIIGLPKNGANDLAK